MIYFASDHAGFALKTELKTHLAEHGVKFEDIGCDDEGSCDYPDYAHALAEQLKAEPNTKGIAICGSGIGISIALNRHSGIRAARCLSLADAEMTRRHNDANVLVFAGRQTEPTLAKQMLDTFLATEFEGGRHETRVQKIDRPSRSS
jgi:ribose 5-phosphate isomerase B